jgi:hypothetical protein
MKYADQAGQGVDSRFTPRCSPPTIIEVSYLGEQNVAEVKNLAQCGRMKEEADSFFDAMYVGPIPPEVHRPHEALKVLVAREVRLGSGSKICLGRDIVADRTAASEERLERRGSLTGKRVNHQIAGLGVVFDYPSSQARREATEARDYGVEGVITSVPCDTDPSIRQLVSGDVARAVSALGYR